MTTDFLLAWAGFVVWATATFTLLDRARPSARRIALAAGLLAIDAAIARAIVPISDASIARLVAAWLLAELALYWVHRAMHRVPLLWRFHALHHADAPVAWTTAWVIHPIDALLFAGCFVVAGAITGAGAAGAVWFIVGRRVWTIVLHADLGWPASALDCIIATPPFHRGHHAHGGNYASTLPVLDRIFGTLHRA
jgi:sterol desaturase/sphingolipid hydroxylase (fatty acid hydroxylase superfamily)